MKTGITILIGAVASTIASYLLFGTSLPPDFYPVPDARDSVLIETHWKQMGGFEKYTPDSLRLGCWSTALAQIMYHHRLKPYGQVSYSSRSGYVIDEQIDSASIDFSTMVRSIDNTTSQHAVDVTAKYNYYAALAVRKDFGTDRYMNKLAPATLFEQHYRVKASRYISWRRTFPNSMGKLKRIIRRELDQKRPLLLHFADLENFGHSVVIDAYKTVDNRLLVHLNQGQGGPQDGWYDFDSAILQPSDDRLRVIYTFEPLLNGR